MDISEYYKNQNIKDRIYEFMGGAEHIVGYGEYELLKKKGEKVKVQLPSGVQEYKILEVK